MPFKDGDSNAALISKGVNLQGKNFEQITTYVSGEEACDQRHYLGRVWIALNS